MQLIPLQIEMAHDETVILMFFGRGMEMWYLASSGRFRNNLSNHRQILCVSISGGFLEPFRSQEHINTQAPHLAPMGAIRRHDEVELIIHNSLRKRRRGPGAEHVIQVFRHLQDELHGVDHHCGSLTQTQEHDVPVSLC